MRPHRAGRTHRPQEPRKVCTATPAQQPGAGRQPGLSTPRARGSESSAPAVEAGPCSIRGVKPCRVPQTPHSHQGLSNRSWFLSPHPAQRPSDRPPLTSTPQGHGSPRWDYSPCHRPVNLPISTRHLSSFSSVSVSKDQVSLSCLEPAFLSHPSPSSGTWVSLLHTGSYLNAFLNSGFDTRYSRPPSPRVTGSTSL